jgi:hypothetical protein
MVQVLLHLQVYRYEILIHPQSAVLAMKLTGPQLDMKFSIFYGTQKFVTTFTKVHLNHIKAVHNLSSYYFIIHINISPIYVSVLQVVYFLQVSPRKPCMYFYTSLYNPHASPTSSSLVMSLYCLGRSRKHEALNYAVLYNLPLIPLTPISPLKYHILEHPRPIFFH